MAKEELDKINRDLKERRLAELREKAILDEIAIRNTGYSDGKEDGIKEGKKKEKINIAKNMLEKNLDKNMISEITGLSLEEIEKLY